MAATSNGVVVSYSLLTLANLYPVSKPCQAGPLRQGMDSSRCVISDLMPDTVQSGAAAAADVDDNVPTCPA
jgi:hypothetical protein